MVMANAFMNDPPFRSVLVLLGDVVDGPTHRAHAGANERALARAVAGARPARRAPTGPPPPPPRRCGDRPAACRRQREGREREHRGNLLHATHIVPPRGIVEALG